MRPFFKDNDFNFLTEIALGSVYRQAADVGEVLTTVDRIHDRAEGADRWVAAASGIRGERLRAEEQIPPDRSAQRDAMTSGASTWPGRWSDFGCDVLGRQSS